MPCTTILVGRKVSYDGSTIIARNDDGGFDTKRVTVVLPKDQPRKYKSVLSHREIELPDDPMRYTAVPNVSKKEGIWAATGINAAHVAMTATETITTNPRVVGADPLVCFEAKKTKRGKDIPGGIGEEDIITITLPYIHSAREGVERLGRLLEEHGTYESNGIAFSDTDEIWWMETIGGHHWIARRVPDDRVVIMPNQFGLDNFDFDDAYGARKDNMCSADLKQFVEDNCLALDMGSSFNPRLAFGSHEDSDHIYNTPRAWYMARYFLPRTHTWDGPSAEYTPISDDIPWSFVPERKVTVEDVRYLLSSYYQGTPYDPYDNTSPLKGKYRSIGVPNSDVSAILQLRGYMPEPLQGVEWLSMGGSGFTACFPVYTDVDKLPKYLSETSDKVSTEYMYWTSRLIAALTNADYNSAVISDDRYRRSVLNDSRKLLCEYDSKVKELLESGSDETAMTKLLEEANDKIVAMVRTQSDKALGNILKGASEHMKTRYHRGDN